MNSPAPPASPTETTHPHTDPVDDRRDQERAGKETSGSVPIRKTPADTHNNPGVPVQARGVVPSRADGADPGSVVGGPVPACDGLKLQRAPPSAPDSARHLLRRRTDTSLSAPGCRPADRSARIWSCCRPDGALPPPGADRPPGSTPSSNGASPQPDETCRRRLRTRGQAHVGTRGQGGRPPPLVTPMNVDRDAKGVCAGQVHCRCAVERAPPTLRSQSPSRNVKLDSKFRLRRL